jgi:hypothetical protein
LLQQGDELETGSLPEVWAKIRGTGPLKQVVVVRDNRYLYAHEPSGNEFELRFRDKALTPGGALLIRACGAA